MNLQQVKGVLTGNLGKLPCPENTALVRRAASNGMVLLKNNGVLPLKGKKVALFGAGAGNPVYCGTGSGFVFTPNPVSVEQGLKNAGITLTSESYLKRTAANEKAVNKKDKSLNFLDRKWSGKTILADAPLPNAQELEAAKAADTAIYVLRRNAGEENDRKAEKGDYYLSDFERADLELLSRNFAHIVVVLNTCVMDLNFANEIPHIDALVYMGLAGMEGGNALADLLTGKANFSGHLTDTFAKQYSDYPAAATFAGADGKPEHPVYHEDIFVGYRHFDTFGIEPLYPFGYGLSYTDFEVITLDAEADWQNITLTVQVKNTGKMAGREVVQVYVSSPAGKLPKPYQELKGYAKTGLIAPGKAETVTITIPTESLASFDEAASAWVMEMGNYLLRVGKHSRNTQVAATVILDATAIVRTVTDILHCDTEIHAPTAPVFENKAEGIALNLNAADCVTIENSSKVEKKTVTYVPQGTDYNSSINGNPFQMPWFCPEETVTVKNCPDATFLDVVSGKVSMEEFVASLPDGVLARIVTGTLEETPYAVESRTGKKLKKISLPQSSGTTTGQYMQSLGIPQALLFDGPAGVHIIGCAATAFPVGMMAAQTWDDALGQELGKAYAREMEAYHITIALGPGMNIHRDPLCGRNFEYYSEDPFLTGKTAAAYTRGVQSVKGRGVSIKHFAANNQETCRTTGNSSISVRALREIYLRGFEIAVRESDPMTVMTSYNELNGVHTSSNRELVTDLLRGEWGFQGLVMTDWGTTSEKAFDLHAGNDLIMGGYRAEKLLSYMRAEAPQFGEDGSVSEIVKSSHFGIVKSYLSQWGSFVPDANGTDTAETTVAAGKEVSEKVREAVKNGTATIRDNADGSKLVTWKGTNRGAYLSRGDMQACAIRVLKMLMDSSAMDDLNNMLK